MIHLVQYELMLPDESRIICMNWDMLPAFGAVLCRCRPTSHNGRLGSTCRDGPDRDPCNIVNHCCVVNTCTMFFLSRALELFLDDFLQPLLFFPPPRLFSARHRYDTGAGAWPSTYNQVTVGALQVERALRVTPKDDLVNTVALKRSNHMAVSYTHLTLPTKA